MGMLNIFQRSYEKNGQYSTPQSTILLQNWKRINLEVANAKAAELSYQNAEMLYMALSPVARENLSILDNEELAAVQVLIGSMMGIRPRKTKRGPGRPRKNPKVSITTDRNIMMAMSQTTRANRDQKKKNLDQKKKKKGQMSLHLNLSPMTAVTATTTKNKL